ncbi:MAG: NAD(P)/FAD-dependent oxidoreductase [Granulosicoccus sp.]
MTNKPAPSFVDDLPRSTDVVIIGGGVVGIFTALELRRRGLSVLVCEKGLVAAEQSSRNWGWIRQQGRDPAELPIMMESIRLWQELPTDLKNEIGFVRCGVTSLAKSEAQLAKFAEWAKVAAEHGLDTKLISQAKIPELLFGGASAPRHHAWLGGMNTSSDARAEPSKAVPAIARLAQQEGVVIRESCAVRTLDISAGKLRGVVTEYGPVSAEQVVLAAGAWSSLFVEQLGISIPQLSVAATVCQTAPLPEFTSGNASDGSIAFRRRQDGGFTLAAASRQTFNLGPAGFRHAWKYLPLIRQSAKSTRYGLAAPRDFPDSWTTARRWSADEQTPFERQRILDPKPNIALVKKAQRLFGERFPDIGEPTILKSWAGMIDTLPDVVPIIDRVPSLEGLIVATGMSGHGFGIGPAVGKLVAQLLTGQAIEHDMKRFRFTRFTDGSALEVGPF